MNEDIEEGDKWKLKVRESVTNSADNRFLDDYAFFVDICAVDVIVNLLNDYKNDGRNEAKLLKARVEGVISELVCDHAIKPEIQDAYWNLHSFIDRLCTISDEEVEVYREILKSVSEFNDSCSVFGKDMKNIYQGKNPCWESQYELWESVASKIEESGETDFIKIVERFYKTCEKCPYR
jgi:hypothetical protein